MCYSGVFVMVIGVFINDLIESVIECYVVRGCVVKVFYVVIEVKFFRL